ncbi:MAG TPA: polysaccharide deacetylase family protein [Streptosporangiaceae bacterium]|jgi:peptidoglycan/xylan/chitin deacetylase (PgdA/CDA1 family)
MILMYHGITRVSHDPNMLCVTPARFAEQMTWLERRGLRGVAVSTLLDAMAEGRHGGMVGITFDDGYRNVLEAALPELQRHGFGATAYVISGYLGGTNDWDTGPAWPLMSADEVGKLAAAGVEIGSHGATHIRLAGSTAGQLAAEISASRTALSALLGTEIRGFCYPFGSMDEPARRAVRDAGYEHACAVQTPPADVGLMALPRIYIGQQDGAARMAVKRRLYSRYIAYRGRRP